MIDFDAMWGGWVIDLARQLEAAAGLPLAARLFDMIGFDRTSGRVIAGGRLAVAPMALLRALTAALLREAGLPDARAEQAVADVWQPPDPVALVRPLADLPALFGALHERGIRIAVATTDDRAPTAATLASLGVAPLVSALAGADDGLPVKPAPDMVVALCRELGIAPARAVVVGDAVADLEMGRAAGAGLVVGVLSGVSPAPLIVPPADVVIPSIAGLIG